MDDLMISVAAKVAKYLVGQIGLQVSHPFTNRRNVQDLLQKFDHLERERRWVQELVEAAKSQGYPILPHVQGWLQDTEGILQTAENFVEDAERASQEGRFHLKSRYKLSKRARRLRADIETKLEQVRNIPARHRPPYPLVSSAFYTTDVAFPSKQSIFKEIMEALRNEQTSILAVWGMGGVGKTTLARQVAKRAQEEKLFDKVVMASSISQTPIISEIQTQLARTLDLTFVEGEDRSVRLMNSLKNQKKILVILDDIWDELDLGAIGIPYGDDHKGCKLLLTSRERKVVATDMKAQQVFHLPHLEAEEAWSLFKRKAGDSVESPELKDIADEIIKKCEGLPIAIITIARALKNKSVGEWKNALEELKRAEPTNLGGLMEKVYSCVELSYNHLESDEVKSLFLLCGLLGGGHISMDHLLLYAAGLNLFGGFHSVEEATDRLFTLVQKLKASSLLLDAEDKDNDGYRSLFFDDSFVKIHNIVHHVARLIASRDGVSEVAELREWGRRAEGKSYGRLSLECRRMDELPPKLVCSQLELLLLMNSSLNRLRIPDAFFQGVIKLRVLHLSGMSLRSSPSSLAFLSNLRTMCLIKCQLEDMTIIGEMKRLQALSLAECIITELPKEIGQLEDLRVLDLQDCTELHIIPQNVVSSLSRLECLSLKGCYNIEWGRGGESNDDKACLSEIKDLPRLRTLDVQVSDPSLLLAVDIQLQLNLTRYSIIIGDDGHQTRLLNKFFRNLMVGGIKSPVVLLKCFSSLFKTCQLLSLVKLDGITDLVYDLDQDGFLQLESLTITVVPLDTSFLPVDGLQ